MDINFLGLSESFSDVIKHLNMMSNEKKVTIVFDIETFTYNTKEGKEFPSRYKSDMFCFAIGYEFDNSLYIAMYPNSHYFINDVLLAYKKIKKSPKVELIQHNGNKFDNHFIRYDLIYYFDCKVYNYYLPQATEEGNINAKKLSDFVKLERKDKNIILERRVKSRVSLDLTFFVSGVQFFTTDNYPKTNSSIDTLGKMLYKKRYIKKDDLKSEMDYESYNILSDLTQEQAKVQALRYFNQLKFKHDDVHYIQNDIKILFFSVKYYSSIFIGFDYSKITYTQNILQRYNINKLSEFQLLNIYQFPNSRSREHFKYTDYHFSNLNLYEYFKRFYKGGLNFYNDEKIGEIINEDIIALDINSSYPYVMHKFKIPTFIEYFEEFEDSTEIEIHHSDDFFALYEISKEYFDDNIIFYLESKIVRKMFVKYYSNQHDRLYINSNTLLMLKEIFGLNIEKLKVYSRVIFKCYDFGSKYVIENFYKIKEQASSKFVLDIASPYDIKETNKLNTDIKTDDEVYNAKVHLNGLYGLPALRSHFNLFRYDGNDFYNVMNGYKNTERNIIFSLFVTSVSFYNLLSPFKFFTADEIDNYFYYCDTDSIFINKKIFNKIPSSFLDPHHLGSWDIDEDNISKMYILNHKKYAFLTDDKITVKCAGVPHDSFDLSVTFEKFIEGQFSDGVELPTVRSIFNEMETVTIYNSKTKLELGKKYATKTYNRYDDILLKQIFAEVREHLKEDGISDGAMYLETPLGSFSITEVFEPDHDIENTQPIFSLYKKQQNYKSFILA